MKVLHEDLKAELCVWTLRVTHRPHPLYKKWGVFSPLTPKRNIAKWNFSKPPLFPVLHQLLLLSAPHFYSVPPLRLVGQWLTHPPCLAGRLCCAHTLYASICIIKKKKKKKKAAVRQLCQNKTLNVAGQMVDPVPLLDYFVVIVFLGGCLLQRFWLVMLSVCSGVCVKKQRLYKTVGICIR